MPACSQPFHDAVAWILQMVKELSGFQGEKATSCDVYYDQTIVPAAWNTEGS